jgi:hypothetical protein
MATGINLKKEATSASVDSDHERLQVDANGYLQQVDSAGNAFPIGEFYLMTQLATLSTSSSAFVAAPAAGLVTELRTVITNAITSADATVTAEIEDVAITGISITVTQSGSAAGDVDSDTATAANTLAANDALEVVTNGNSSTACVTPATFSVQRT